MFLVDSASDEGKGAFRIFVVPGGASTLGVLLCELARPSRDEELRASTNMLLLLYVVALLGKTALDTWEDGASRFATNAVRKDGAAVACLSRPGVDTGARAAGRAT